MIDPPVAHGVRFMSLGLMLEDDQPAIMRGPLISGILKQFLEQVDAATVDMIRSAFWWSAAALMVVAPLTEDGLYLVPKVIE